MRTFETCCYEGFVKVKKVTNSGIIILTLDYAVYEEVNRELRGFYDIGIVEIECRECWYIPSYLKEND